LSDHIITSTTPRISEIDTTRVMVCYNDRMITDKHIGNKYNRWLVLSYSHKSGRNHYYTCRCECGTVKPVRLSRLMNGESASCGCYRTELSTIHGLAKRNRVCPELYIRNTMIQRCTNKNNIQYPEYGGRGIVVCDRWLESFENFFNDMGPRPSKHHSIERLDNNGNYEPGNCAWATRLTQNRNKRNNRYLEVDGIKRCLAEWVTISGVAHPTILARLKCGWPVKKAIFTPARRAA